MPQQAELVSYLQVGLSSQRKATLRSPGYKVKPTLVTPLLLSGSRYQEMALGVFVADAYRAYHGTQIGWMNGGGLRTNALGPNFTKRDAYAIVPFDSKTALGVIDVTTEGRSRSCRDTPDQRGPLDPRGGVLPG